MERRDKRVVDVKVIPPYTIDVTFDDESHNVIDMAEELWGEAFEPLKDEAYFAQVKVDDIGGIYWPNGADVSPEFLNTPGGEWKKQS